MFISHEHEISPKLNDKLPEQVRSDLREDTAGVLKLKCYSVVSVEHLNVKFIRIYDVNKNT